MEEKIEIVSVPEGKIKDYIDGTFRKDTQEEYVRQNILKRLVNELGYPKDLIQVEIGITKTKTIWFG